MSDGQDDSKLFLWMTDSNEHDYSVDSDDESGIGSTSDTYEPRGARNARFQDRPSLPPVAEEHANGVVNDSLVASLASMSTSDAGASSDRSSSQYERKARKHESAEASQSGQRKTPATQASDTKSDARKPQTFRRLWQQVTQVEIGKAPPRSTTMPMSDTTVEGLLRLTMGLPSNQPCIPHIMHALYSLDSSALAALLKELGKHGQLQRAVEIFDWLRKLPLEHDLAPLLDIKTYTTAVSQCGSHKQLPRALELVAEMRARGVMANCHFFSALINVCIRGNEYELALDVYEQMLREGIQPNLVTYNTLIEVWSKLGKVNEVVAVLDHLAAQNIQPEVRTYNTIINACNRNGQPEQALKVYNRMLACGVKPSATTYTALITAHGKQGQLHQAIKIFQDMLVLGCERNVITYSSLISACERVGAWDVAIHLLNEMLRENCLPNIVTFNSLMAACINGGQWQKALDMFAVMQQMRCQPDSLTFIALLKSLGMGARWGMAMRAYENLFKDVARPNPNLYHLLLDCLWGSGLAAAEELAFLFWQQANQQGRGWNSRFKLLSSDDAGTVEFAVVATTAGSAVVTLLKWLAELRAKVQKQGSQWLKNRVVLHLQKGKHSRSAEHPARMICTTLHVLLCAARSPCKVQILGQATSLSVATNVFSEWICSPQADTLFRRMKSDVLQDGQIPAGSLMTLFVAKEEEDQRLEAQCSSAYAAVLQREDVYVQRMSMMTSQASTLRSSYSSLAKSYGTACAVDGAVVHETIMLMDSVVAVSKEVPRQLLPVLTAACMVLASRTLPTPVTVERVAAMSHVGGSRLTTADVNSALSTVQTTVGMAGGPVSALRLVQLFSERLSRFGPEYASCNEALSKLLDEAFDDPVLHKVRPTIVAACAYALVNKELSVVPFWPRALLGLTGIHYIESLLLHVQNHRLRLSSLQQLVNSLQNAISSAITLESIRQSGSGVGTEMANAVQQAGGFGVPPGLPLMESSMGSMADLSMGSAHGSQSQSQSQYHEGGSSSGSLPNLAAIVNSAAAAGGALMRSGSGSVSGHAAGGSTRITLPSGGSFSSGGLTDMDNSPMLPPGLQSSFSGSGLQGSSTQQQQQQQQQRLVADLLLRQQTASGYQQQQSSLLGWNAGQQQQHEALALLQHSLNPQGLQQQALQYGAQQNLALPLKLSLLQHQHMHGGLDAGLGSYSSSQSTASKLSSINRNSGIGSGQPPGLQPDNNGANLRSYNSVYPS